jgi:acyl-CoA reductase-like NAD-dependent aldehyde dehydrogenase
MGALVSRAHRDRVLGYIARGQAEGARLVAGGGPPAEPGLADGCFIEPTVFAGVTQDMTIAREEIFGPVLSVHRWDDPQAMLADVNSTPFGLTCSIWTSDLAVAHETAAAAEAGYVWVNEVARHRAAQVSREPRVGLRTCRGGRQRGAPDAHLHKRGTGWRFGDDQARSAICRHADAARPAADHHAGQ